jgi:UDP-N-acetylmuramoyl-L-alanyl-D-glutamate--2,6-diaminopimelate ligase
MDGVQKCAAMRLVADRERALRWAIAEAQPQDTILMIGGSGASAHQQRSEIREITRWVASERQQNQTRAPHPSTRPLTPADAAPSAPVLKIAKF